jgi:hypothetical protein
MERYVPCQYPLTKRVHPTKRGGANRACEDACGTPNTGRATRLRKTLRYDPKRRATNDDARVAATAGGRTAAQCALAGASPWPRTLPDRAPAT